MATLEIQNLHAWDSVYVENKITKERYYNSKITDGVTRIQLKIPTQVSQEVVVQVIDVQLRSFIARITLLPFHHNVVMINRIPDPLFDTSASDSLCPEMAALEDKLIKLGRR
jgi:hypothetical protein